MSGLCNLQYKTVLCNIRTLQSCVPCADVMGMCKLQDNIVLCYTHYIRQSFLMAISFSVVTSPKQHVSAKLELHHDYT